MIKNEKQYAIAKKSLNDIRIVIEEYTVQLDDGDILQQMEKKSAESKCKDIEEEIREYEGLKGGIITSVSLRKFEDIPELLIKGRIARGLTQAELAIKCGLKEQQIQRYEATNFASASLKKIQDILEILEIEMPPINVLVNTPAFRIPNNINQEQLIRKQSSLVKKNRCLV